MPSLGSARLSMETLLSPRTQTSDDIAALLRVGSLLNSTLELKEVLRLSMEEAAKLTGAEASSILLIEEGTGDLVFEVATGSKGEGAKEIRLRRGEGIAGWVASHGRPARVLDAQGDRRFTARVDKKTEYVTRSILCVPLKLKDRVTGVLEVINKQSEERFTDHDEELLVILSHQIATAIDNAQLYRQVYEEKETLRAVLDSMADGVLVVDPEDKILMFNPAMLDVLGIHSGELSPSCFGEGGIWGSADPESADGKTSLSYDLEVQADGASRTLATTATVLKDPAGHVTGWVMVMRDVTEAARLEKMKNDFIATTSHKLRTPLTSILGFASLLGNKKLREATTGGDDEDIVGEAAIAIETQSRYLRELIEKLLNFTGMDPGEMELDMESTDAGLLLREASETVRSWSCANASKAKVTLETPPEELEVRVDRAKMSQVLKNLLENAVKFCPAGSPAILGAAPAEDEIRFWVSDRGPGIPREEQDRIFEKFYQIDRDLTGQVEGAGLGLALCKNIVLAHGGRIEVESEPGQGSTFNVYLPRKARPS